MKDDYCFISCVGIVMNRYQVKELKDNNNDS